MNKLKFEEIFFNPTVVNEDDVVLGNYLNLYYELHKKSFAKSTDENENKKIYLMWVVLLNGEKKIFNKIAKDKEIVEFFSKEILNLDIFDGSVKLTNFDKYYFKLFESDFNSWGINLDAKIYRERYGFWIAEFATERSKFFNKLSNYCPGKIRNFIDSEIKLNYKEIKFYLSNYKQFHDWGISLDSISGYKKYFVWSCAYRENSETLLSRLIKSNSEILPVNSIEINKEELQFYFAHYEQFQEWGISLDSISGYKKYFVWSCAYRENSETLLSRLIKSNSEILPVNSIEINKEELQFYFAHYEQFQEWGISLDSISGYKKYLDWLITYKRHHG